MSSQRSSVSKSISDSMSGYPRILQAHTSHIAEEWCYNELRAPYWRFYVNETDGARIHLRDGSIVPLRPGHLVIVPAWLSWSASCRRPVVHHHAQVDIVGLARQNYDRHWQHVYDLGTSTGAAFLTAMQLGNPERHWRLLSFFATCMADLAALNPSGFNHIDQHGLSQPLRLIEAQLPLPMRLEQLAELSGLSTATLNRRFRTQLQCSPADYIRDRRLTLIADMLIHSEDSIESIASQAGFSDRQALSKAFRAVIGESPATWRQQHRVRI